MEEVLHQFIWFYVSQVVQDFYHQQYPLPAGTFESMIFLFDSGSFGTSEHELTVLRHQSGSLFFLPANILGTLRLRLHCDFVASSGLKLIAQWFRGLSLARSLEFIIDLSTGGNGPMISSLGMSRR